MHSVARICGMTKMNVEQDRPMTPAALRELAALARILASRVISATDQCLFDEMADKLEAEAATLDET
jgi:hypothetical protein